MFQCYLKVNQITLIICAITIFGFGPTVGLFDFLKEQPQLSIEDQEFLNSIPKAQWIKSVNFGWESVEKRKRQEEIILSSQITIQNGSLSHSQLLDSLPNEQAQVDSDLAMKILKSTLHVNAVCLEHGIGARRCSILLNKKELPEETILSQKCKEIIQSRRDGHHAFRRLLPRRYKDFFYDMYSESDSLPSPRAISAMALPAFGSELALDDKHRNLALIQWTQFIEHDLSKPVVTSMRNGAPIECCSTDNYNLLPRYRHFACAPLLLKNSSYVATCLNYVRSALAVGDSCSFGAAEQLNQATGYFDLSQLYGFTKSAQNRMRSKDGKIKSSYAGKTRQELLPLAAEEANEFCAFKSNNYNTSICFMAGDSRVNSNPFAITIYTIFLRNHNNIAQILKRKNSDWNDEKLYQTAKAINIDIYRHIVFNEWFPEILGKETSEKINKETFELNSATDHAAFHISNEFAVAAIRFYYSMMPDALYNLPTINKDYESSYTIVHSNDVLPHANIFVLRDQLYKPNLLYSPKKLDEILESVLHQRAMKMDATYVSSLIPDTMGNVRPTHADILAFDIQRGRDHGIQTYIKYSEICNGVEVNDWHDLESFIPKENILKLQSVYNNVTDIDLIVGGIAELPILDGTVGPTFTCILGEQFSKIRKWHHLMGPNGVSKSLLMQFHSITAADLLCANSELKQVPTNIFRLPYEKNPMVSCADRSELQFDV